MNIKVINENKNYWYYNRKGLVCKVVEEIDEFYVVKVWLNKKNHSFHCDLVYILIKNYIFLTLTAFIPLAPFSNS